MSGEFRARRAPREADWIAAAALAPANPFCTAAFVQAQASLGAEPWLFEHVRDGQVITACPAFVRDGRLNKSAEIISLPAPTDDEFWRGLVGFCREHGITDLLLNSYASPSARIPDLSGEYSRETRCEYVVDLVDAAGGFSKNHSRNIKAASKAGFEVRVAGDTDSCATHVGLMQQSLERRSARGEDVSNSPQMALTLALVRTGAGTLFQAARDGEVQSSILVLTSTAGAYYHSAGTSPTGMSGGASHFLVSEIIRRCREQGMTQFNLGGAGAESAGLMRFKAGFGAREVPLEAAACYLGSQLRRKLADAARYAHTWIRRARVATA